MTESLYPKKWQLCQAVTKGHDHRQHCSYSGKTEHCRHYDNRKYIALGCRVHQKRDQWLARSKYEYKKKDPGCYIGAGPCFVKMGMVFIVGMKMLMRLIVMMMVKMGMGPVADRSM